MLNRSNVKNVNVKKSCPKGTFLCFRRTLVRLDGRKIVLAIYDGGGRTSILRT